MVAPYIRSPEELLNAGITSMLDFFHASIFFYDLDYEELSKKCMIKVEKSKRKSLLDKLEANVHFHDLSEDENYNIETNRITESERYKEKNIKDDDVINDDTNIITYDLPFDDITLRYFFENPDKIYCMPSSEFERFMAEIYHRLGYNVELTKFTRDGGKDIILTEKNSLGDFKYYVECKKYRPNRAVGVEIVRGITGLIFTEGITAGIIATTSYFSKSAKDYIFDRNLKYKLLMHDFVKIKDMLKRIIGCGCNYQNAYI